MLSSVFNLSSHNTGLRSQDDNVRYTASMSASDGQIYGANLLKSVIFSFYKFYLDVVFRQQRKMSTGLGRIKVWIFLV